MWDSYTTIPLQSTARIYYLQADDTKMEQKQKYGTKHYFEHPSVSPGHHTQLVHCTHTRKAHIESPFHSLHLLPLPSSLQLTTTQAPLVVNHFLYTAWPDHGVVQYTVSIHRFIRQDVRPVYNDSSAPLTAPPLPSPTAGEGRGGEEGRGRVRRCIHWSCKALWQIINLSSV